MNKNRLKRLKKNSDRSFDVFLAVFTFYIMTYVVYVEQEMYGSGKNETRQQFEKKHSNHLKVKEL